MIRALNLWRINLGEPTVPTISGTRTASRNCRKRWSAALEAARALERARLTVRWQIELHRDLEACPDNMLGEPNARELGRFVRMARAVRAGFEAPLGGVL